MIQRRNRRRACDVVNWARPARGKAGRPRAQPRGGHDGRTEPPGRGEDAGCGDLVSRFRRVSLGWTFREAGLGRNHFMKDYGSRARAVPVNPR